MRDGRYTMGEAARALNVDAKTLRDWLDKEGIEPTQDKYDARRKWLTSEQLALVAEAHERTPRAPVTLADALERIAELESEVMALKDARTGHLAHQTRYDGQEGGSGVSADGLPVSPARKRPVARVDVPAMPDGLVSVVDFSALHGVPRSTLMDVVNKGRIVLATGGPWPGERNPILQALDQQGQHQAWLCFHERPKFRPCADCPHE